VVRRGASPKGGSRDNHRIRWPKIMTAAEEDAWYEKVDKIRQRAVEPAPKRIFLPAARILVPIEELP